MWAWKQRPDFEKLLGVEKSSSSKESLDSSKTSLNQNCTRYLRITKSKRLNRADEYSMISFRIDLR